MLKSIFDTPLSLLMSRITIVDLPNGLRLSYQRHGASPFAFLVDALEDALIFDDVAVYAPWTLVSVLVSSIPLAGSAV